MGSLVVWVFRDAKRFGLYCDLGLRLLRRLWYRRR